MKPDAVHLDANEKSIGRCRAPAGERREGVRAERWIVDCGLRTAERGFCEGSFFPKKAWQCVCASARIFHSAVASDEDDLLAVPFVFVAADLPLVFDDLVAHAREQ